MLLPLALAQAANNYAEQPSTAVSDLVGFLWGLAYIAPLLLRRRNPDLMGALIVVPHLIQLIGWHEMVPGNLALPFVFYALAAYAPRRHVWPWFAAGIGSSLAGAVRWAYALNVTSSQRIVEAVAYFIGCAAVVSASWFFGALTRASRENVDALRERNAALLGERDQSAKLAVAEERARIAREMHDIVAHSLSLIVVQTDGAAYVASLDGDSREQLETTRRALETIGSTARTALADTRRLVGVLNDETAAYAPQATLAEIPALVERVRDAGYPCDLTVRGDHTLHPLLEQPAQMAAYRIVQESLTNVMKHAGPGAHVEVVLTDTPAGLDILVTDDGHGPVEPDGLGHGIIGMRERATSVGGTFDAHPNPRGGFTVHATIPPSKETA